LRPLRTARGFTLVEIAVVLAIVGLLLGSLMYTLSAQLEQRNFEETRRRLEAARELLLGFALINGRLPCPARSAATAAPVTVAGDEVRSAAGDCIADAVTDYYGGVNAGVTLGLLPARAIGFQQTDAAGFAVDAWGNRIRYAVSGAALTGCVGSSTLPHFTNSTNLKANGITCQPNDLVICKSATGITATTCGPAANALTNQTVVVAIVYSVGKNGSLGCAPCVDEAANINGDRVFVSHTPAPATAANGEFDDYLVWIAVGELYGRLISAGVLP
jgi:prepilin-type N-terminal cleavage/methylation domain-containing protein